MCLETLSLTLALLENSTAVNDSAAIWYSGEMANVGQHHYIE